MKKAKLIFTVIFLLFNTLVMLAQNPPNPPDVHGGNNDQGPGGNAAVASGTVILIGLGVLYGGKRFYDLRNRTKKDQ
jgi:hypothetical protein